MAPLPSLPNLTGVFEASPEYLVLFLVPAALSLVAVVHLLRRSKRHEPRNELIPGVPLIPYPVHWFFGHSRVKATDTLARQQVWCVDHADSSTGLCSFYMLRRPVVSVLKAEHAQQILKSNTLKEGIISGPLVNRLGERSFGRKNMVRMNGREWRIHRASASRALVSENSLRVAQRHIKIVGNSLVASIIRRAEEDECRKQASYQLVSLMKMATLDVFCSSALGRDLGCCRDLEPSEVAAAFDFIGEDIIRRFRALLSPASHLFWLPTKANRRLAHSNRILRNFLRETITSHMDRVKNYQGDGDIRANGYTSEDWDLNQNLLAQFIAINNSKDTSEEARLNVDEIADTLLVMLFAGYDTTANALSFALHEIATNPSVEERCVAEARAVLGSMDDGHFDVMASLPYCNAALLEALRLHPPAIAVPRTLEKTMVFDGVALPAGTMVRIPIYNIHRDPRNFPDPTKFIPERWVQQTTNRTWERRMPDELGDENKVPPAGKSDAFLAFSTGARNCVGRRFAQQEGTLLLAMIVRSLKFEAEPGYKLEGCLAGPIMEPKGGLPMRISQRL